MNKYEFNSIQSGIVKLLEDAKQSTVSKVAGEEVFNRDLDNYELGVVELEISDAKNRDVFQSRSQMIYSILDTIYVLSGRNDSYVMTQHTDFYKLFNGNGFFNNAFGKRVYELYGNQMNFVYNELKKRPNSTDAIIYMKGRNWSDFDCTMYIQFIKLNNKLNIVLSYKASDIIVYLQSDLFKYSVLLELMSKWLDMPMGSIYFFSSKMYYLKEYQSVTDHLIKQYNTVEPKYSKVIPIEMDYKSSREVFFNAIDIINSWYKFKERNLDDYIEEIKYQKFPYFLENWLMILLTYKYYKEDKVVEYNTIFELLEPTIYKYYFEFFKSFQAHPLTEFE